MAPGSLWHGYQHLRATLQHFREHLDVLPGIHPGDRREHELYICGLWRNVHVCLCGLAVVWKEYLPGSAEGGPGVGRDVWDRCD